VYLLQTLGAVALYPGPGEEPVREPLLRGSKTLVLAAYVAQRPGRTASREHLAELFWPGRASRGRRSLRQALYYLARSGGKGILVAEGDGVRFRPDLCSLDAERFETALRDGRFEDAVGLYEGPFLAGFDPVSSRELAHWIESVRGRLEVGLRQALREAAQTALVRGDPEEAVALGRRGARHFPLDDRLHELLLEALVRAGRPDEAVREYEAFRVLLREQLEDTPSDDLTEIAERARAAVPRVRAIEPEARVGGGTDAPTTDAAEPVPEPAPTTGPPPRAPRPTARRTEHRLLLVVGILLIAVVAAWLASVVRGSRAVRAPATAEGSGPGGGPVLLTVQVGTDGFATLAVHGDPPDSAVVVATGEPNLLAYLSPDGRHRARRVPTTNGPDIAIDDLRSGETVAEVPNRDGRTPDDHALGWSPDGRFLLFDSGLPTDDGGYDQRLFAYDLALGSTRAVIDLQLPMARAAAWSPRGDVIAVTAHPPGVDRREPGARTDLYLVTPGGDPLRRLTDDEAVETEPAWSPDGTRIAFQRDYGGDADIRVMDVATGETAPVAATAWSELSPAWLSVDWIAFTADRGDGHTLWVVPASGGEPRPLVDGPRAVRVIQRLGPAGHVPWIETVEGRVSTPGGALSPGEHAQLEVAIVASDSTPVAPSELPFAWRSLDPDRAVPLGMNLLLVHDTGDVRLVADVAGWRADTVALRSLPLVVDGFEPALAEDWLAGIDEPTWRTYGDPEPVAELDGGPDGTGRFRSRGDASGESGAVSRRRFSLARGLTVAAWGRVPLTGAMYQTFTVGLTRDTTDDPGAGHGPMPDVAAIRLMSRGLGAAETTFLEGGTRRIGVPEPPGIGEWRRHLLQLHPDATLEWLIDGRRFASARLDGPLPDSVHVVLGGRSVGTEIEHGPVRVWEGIRYVPVRNLPDGKP